MARHNNDYSVLPAIFGGAGTRHRPTQVRPLGARAPARRLRAGYALMGPGPSRLAAARAPVFHDRALGGLAPLALSRHPPAPRNPPSPSLRTSPCAVRLRPAKMRSAALRDLVTSPSAKGAFYSIFVIQKSCGHLKKVKSAPSLSLGRVYTL